MAGPVAVVDVPTSDGERRQAAVPGPPAPAGHPVAHRTGTQLGCAAAGQPVGGPLPCGAGDSTPGLPHCSIASSAAPAPPTTSRWRPSPARADRRGFVGPHRSLLPRQRIATRAGPVRDSAPQVKAEARAFTGGNGLAWAGCRDCSRRAGFSGDRVEQGTPSCAEGSGWRCLAGLLSFSQIAWHARDGRSASGPARPVRRSSILGAGGALSVIAGDHGSRWSSGSHSSLLIRGGIVAGSGPLELSGSGRVAAGRL